MFFKHVVKVKIKAKMKVKMKGSYLVGADVNAASEDTGLSLKVGSPEAPHIQTELARSTILTSALFTLSTSPVLLLYLTGGRLYQS